VYKRQDEVNAYEKAQAEAEAKVFEPVSELVSFFKDPFKTKSAIFIGAGIAAIVVVIILLRS